MNKSYTPGPWFYDRPNATKEQPNYILTSDRTEVALVYSWNLNDPDTRLIAAAPDLFEAGKALLADLSDDERCDCCGDPSCPDYQRCAKCAMRAAIDKVENNEDPHQAAIEKSFRENRGKIT